LNALEISKDVFMKISHSVSVPSAGPQVAPWWEIMALYGAAYLCTLITIVAAQLVIRTEIATVLSAITLVGWPLSLWLRRARLVIGGVRLPRPLVNSGVMFLSFVVSLWSFTSTVPSLSPVDLSQYFGAAGAGQLMLLMMQTFLTFAACRCLAIINDKDAVLCTLPSFSVLLLLIVVHKGPEVVAYFLAWAIVAAILFALDHRRELRRGLSGRVPALVPGQEANLSARGLAGVLSFSMIAAVGLSYGLSRGNPEEAARANWVQNLASHLSRFALDLPDVSVNGGPERQIDFSSGPALPTRAPLWQVTPVRFDGRSVRPLYWRMFTFANYDGRSWSQIKGAGTEVVREPLDAARWPLILQQNSRFNSGEKFTEPPPPEGYDVQRYGPRSTRAGQFGASPVRVKVTIEPLVTNTGFIPILPGARALTLSSNNPYSVRVHDDGAIDVNILRFQQPAQVLCDIPAQIEYGLEKAAIPLSRAQKPNPRAHLSEEERAQYLKLPPTLPPQVRQWARDVVARSASNDSDYARANRLLQAIDEGAAYTLRPSPVPADRDATDYFLFASRRGYCTYFAGALTVTCRAVGIPARVVSGFTNPEWQENNNTAILRESGAHAWTEIWVPNWGWALLDATPGDDRGHNAPSFAQSWQDLWGAVTDRGGLLGGSRRWSLLLVLGLGVLCARLGRRSGALSLRFDRLGWNGLFGRRGAAPPPEDALARRAIIESYARVSRTAARRFRPAAPWETPLEWLQAAEAALQLRDPAPLRRLTELYIQARYSPRAFDRNDIQDAHAAARNLSWRSDAVAESEK